MMWARVIEFGLGVWLALSPFIFGHAGSAAFLWVNDLACAALVVAVALLSFAPSLDKLHLLNGLVGLWLLGVGFLAAPSPPPPALQNHVCIGLLLVMFSVLPSWSASPPASWQRFLDGRRAGADTVPAPSARR